MNKVIDIKKIIILSFVALLSIVSENGIKAQEATDFVYVNANSVNIRKAPNVNSEKLSTKVKYYCFQKAKVSCPSDWTPVTFEDFSTNKMMVGYISSQYVTNLTNYPIEKEQLKDKPLRLAVEPGSELSGSLTFDFKGNSYQSYYRVVNDEWVKEGGSGTVDWANIEGEWKMPGFLTVTKVGRAYNMTDPMDKYVIYDKPKGLLLFGGSLWIVPSNKEKITSDFINKVRNYDDLKPFNNGLAAVKKDGRNGYIDPKGNEAIPIEYEEALYFAENGLAGVKKNGKWGFINKSGEPVIPFKWDNIGSIGDKSIVMDGFQGFKDGAAIVKDGNKYGVINSKGELITPLLNYEIEDYKFGYAILKEPEGSVYGVMGANGKMIVPVTIAGEDGGHSFTFYKGKLVDPNDYSMVINLDGTRKKENVVYEENNYGNNEEGKLADNLIIFYEEGKEEVGFKNDKGKQIFPACFSLPLNEYGSVDNNYMDLNQEDLIWVSLNFSPEYKYTYDASDLKSGYIDGEGNSTFTAEEIQRAIKSGGIRAKNRPMMEDY